MAAAVMRAIARVSCASRTASNSACLPSKWWYTAPRVTWLATATSSRDVPAYPRVANKRVASSSSAARVASEYSSRRLWVLTCCMRRV